MVVKVKERSSLAVKTLASVSRVSVSTSVVRGHVRTRLFIVLAQVGKNRSEFTID